MAISIPLVGEFDLELEASMDSVDPPVVYTTASTSQIPGATVELITDGEEAWLRYTGGAEPVVPGLQAGTWVRGDFEEFVELDILEPLDEGLAFLDLLYCVTSITDAGEEQDAGGGAATRFDVVVDFDAAVDAAPTERADALEERIVLTGAGGPLIFEGSAWIDEAGHIVGLALDGTAPVDGDDIDDEFTVDVVVELSEIGGDVDVPEPPTEDVVTLDDLLG